MKRTFIAFLFAFLASCQSDTQLPPATSAAAKIFHQYADTPNLTVTLIGDYHKDGHTFNAVMLQAQDDQAWTQLLNEFGISPIANSLTTRLDSNSTLLPIRVSALSSVYFHNDTIPGDMDDYFQALKDSLINGYGHFDNNIALKQKKIYQDGQLIDSTTIVQTGQSCATPPINNRLLHAAIDDEQTGYVFRLESSCRTVWLFFYSNKQEYETILHNIRPQEQF